ncbi:MAG: hypothetical protein B6D34_03935 [Candidatus Brocadia sp. UTAMX1]|jgi:hypothetical protein|nr:MAG: hypothetical protein B6D34_03935 [Candidatus Brocadia sp. UTAMX1]
MGIVRMGPPTELIYELKSAFGISRFIETGTFLGDTAHWASKIFEKVITIECSDSYYNQTIQKYGYINNIEFLYGDTKYKLSEILPNIGVPAIFWLDAHWCGGQSYGKGDECPLIQEIETINKSSYDNFIFIDDARLFMSPPPRPHLIDQWPDISMILNSLTSVNNGRYIVIIEDVIIAVPIFAKSIVARYCQQINTKLSLEDSSNFRKGLKLIFLSLKNSWLKFAIRFIKKFSS